MEAADSSPPVEVSTVRLLPFWAELPAAWIAQAEAQFALASISSEKIKFCHIILQLDHEYATGVEDMITSLPNQNPFTTLWTEL
jgi:hypothetical protein